jgi:hypothetical protein
MLPKLPVLSLLHNEPLWMMTGLAGTLTNQHSDAHGERSENRCLSIFDGGTILGAVE